MPPAGLSSTRSKRQRTGADSGRKGDGKKYDGLYHCDYCGKDLSASLRIKCAVCPDFDLCLECFSVGAEVTPHSNSHAYRVVDNLSFPLYSPNWGADEELLLLEAVEQYGVGSWARAAEHVGRGPEDCKAHYFAVYVDTDAFPLPKPTAEMATVDIRRLIEERHSSGQERIVKAPPAVKAVGPPRRGRPPGSISRPKPPAAPAGSAGGGGSQIKQEMSEDATGSLVPEEQVVGEAAVESQGPQAKKQRTWGADVAREVTLPGPLAEAPADAGAAQGGRWGGWIGGVEGAVAVTPAALQALPSSGGKSMQATPLLAGDGAALLAQTEAQQTGYHVKRNEFEPEYDPDAETLVAELDFADDEPPEEAARKLRLIEIYNRRLDERQRRKDFVLSRGLLNVKRQASVDRKRAPAERELLGRLRLLARGLPQAQWDALAEGVAAELRLRSRIAELQKYRTLGMRTFAEVERYEAVEVKRRKDPAPVLQGGKSRLTRLPVDESALESELAALGAPHAAQAVHAQHTAVPEGRGPTGLEQWRLKRGVSLDITCLPDLGALSQRERDLCARERFLPAQYLAVKAEVARMQAEQGWVENAAVQALPFLVDPERAVRLLAFFLELGWVAPPPPLAAAG